MASALSFTIPKTLSPGLRGGPPGGKATRRHVLTAMARSATAVQVGAVARLKARLSARGGRTGASGGLLKSSFVVRDDSAGSARIGFAAPYAEVYEFGRKAGKMPPTRPVDVIGEWLRIKGLPAKLAFPIRRAIGKHGTKPNPYLIPAFRVEVRKLPKRIKRELAAGGWG